MVVTLAMKTMIPLRAVGAISSIFQIAFALLAGITPMLIQHCALLPLNAYRLYEQTMLVRRVRKASSEDLSIPMLAHSRPTMAAALRLKALSITRAA